ncbi:MAG TPA: hypothetical protein VF173_24460 [Thermoanaerobaculia bacterium]|nr:hypothetical protein [Thermoanaerobaculia bacterium]
MPDVTINAVAFQRHGLWVAQCLEYNLVSCAESLEELPNELLSQVLGQIKADKESGQEPFWAFKPAPQHYWDMFAQAKTSPPLKPRKVVPAVDTRLFPMPAAA